uniref:Uncharacterized protein n=1 Tax=Amphimedon queenslandica TaxID=400682 RepID=A0A1X7TL58_AMPQE
GIPDVVLINCRMFTIVTAEILLCYGSASVSGSREVKIDFKVSQFIYLLDAATVAPAPTEAIVVENKSGIHEVPDPPFSQG